jgi:hypothetical protein
MIRATSAPKRRWSSRNLASHPSLHALVRLVCKSVKVKRLFFWFAERHQHAWLKQIDKSKVNLGTGKRMLVKGGKLDTKYLITMPDDLNAPV